MPMGIVSDDEFEREMKRDRGVNPGNEHSSDNVGSAEVVTKINRGRKEGDNNIPDSLRKVIAEEHLLNGRSAALSLAAEFGVSSSQVSAYANGATSTASYNSPAQSIISHINKSRERAIKRASKTLNAALGSITQEKLDYSDAKDLSAIAKDMSAIIKNLEPSNQADTEGVKPPQFVIFAPQFRKEETFETIVVNE